MASSALIGKMEVDIEVNASPQQFHDMFANKPHQVPYACHDLIQGCDLHEGEWGKVGSIITWRYMQEGKAIEAKDLVEVIDTDKHLIRFKAIEADKLEDQYKSFATTVQVRPKNEGNGGIARWTFDYERMHEGIGHPENDMRFARDLTKGIDAYLTRAKCKRI